MSSEVTHWEALGTSVALAATDPAALESARPIVEHELEAIDLACSRFRPDSELMRLNAAGRTVEVSELLIEAVTAGLRAARLTEGRVDPALGDAIELAGYDRDYSQLQTPGGQQARDKPPAPRITVRIRAGWRAVQVNPDRRTITLPRGVRLDLGATAKALAADRAAHAAAAAVDAGVLVSLGGDVAVAGLAPEGGWPIALADDHRASPDSGLPVVSIVAGGLATSSTTARRWMHNGREMHHILDPRTGQPVREVWRTVSVAAPSCLDANIATTAALVAGSDAQSLLHDMGLPARLVAADGTIRFVGAWPQDSQQRAA
jgi:thiamine biosynthesis lipoprotein